MPEVSDNEYEYKKSGRALVYMVLLYLPFFSIVLFGAIKIFHSVLPGFIFAGLWMFLIVLLSVRRFRDFYRWKRSL